MINAGASFLIQYSFSLNCKEWKNVFLIFVSLSYELYVFLNI